MVSSVHLNISLSANFSRSRLKVAPKDGVFVAQQIWAPQNAVLAQPLSFRKSTPGVCGNDSEKSTLGVCENGSEKSALGICGNGSEKSTLGVCENDSEKSTLGVSGNDTEKSTLGVCGNGSEKSFTIYYLINSCGLSSKEAVAASKRLCFKSPEKPDAVLKLLREYGFTDAHILRTVIRWPPVLVACPEKILLPKLEFFRSIGVPLSALPHTLSRHPYVLRRSLEKSIIPSYNELKAILKSDERVARAFLRAPRAFQISPNISTLRERGVPESSIVSLVRNSPSLLAIGKDKLAASADRAIKMGFDPSKASFVLAVQVLVSMTESSLKHKMDLYRRCGWSDSDVVTAFLRRPLCMMYSEKKIVTNMDFLVNEFGCTPATIAASPSVVGYSLEKRIKPRCLVARILDEKGLKKMRSVVSLLGYPEETFLDKYIFEYEKYIPNLLDIYQGKLNPDECVFSQ